MELFLNAAAWAALGLGSFLVLVAGLGLLELGRRWVPNGDFLRDPDVELGSVLMAVVAIVVAGLAAGLVPAWQAAAVPPVVALQDE